VLLVELDLADHLAAPDLPAGVLLVELDLAAIAARRDLARP
jgi:hypothetical protein